MNVDQAKERQPLEFEGIRDESLDDFKPKKPRARTAPDRRPVGQYPSREAPGAHQNESWAQLNLRVQTRLEKRFKTLAKVTGLKHYALLEQALNAFEDERK